MKKILIIFLLLVGARNAFSQEFVCGGIEEAEAYPAEGELPVPQEGATVDCANRFDYIPNANTPMKVVRVNFHFMLKTDSDPHNFTASSDGAGSSSVNAILYANQVIIDANSRLSTNQKMNLPVGNSTAVLARRYRLSLKGVYFHTNANDYLYNNLNVNNYSVNATSEINIFFVEDNAVNPNSTWGVGSMTMSNPNIKISNLWKNYMQNYKYSTVNSFSGLCYSSARLLIHELGHNFGLHHTVRKDNGPCYNMNDGCDDTPTRNAMKLANGVDPCICTNVQECNPVDPGGQMHLRSNNLMDYEDGDALTPEQLGIIHMYLSGRLSGFLEQDFCDAIANNSWKSITQSQTLVIPGTLSENLVISNNAVVEIPCGLKMRKNSSVHIAFGSKLIALDVSTCDGGCSPLNFNIAGEMEVSNTHFRFLSGSNVTISGILRVSTIRGLCIGEGVNFVIMPGAKVYVKDVDYTQKIINGYNSYYDRTISNQTLTSPVYARNIMTFDNDLTSGVVTAEAGKRIVLSPGFTGSPGFEARIDRYINNQCSTYSCGAASGPEPGPEPAPLPSEKASGNEELGSVNVNIFPNPNSGSFMIVVDYDALGASLSISDLTGRVVYSGFVTKLNENYDLPVVEGVYIVSLVKADGSIVTQKMVLQ
ncbi:MAG: zinc-dependent metalloprotease [Flavobacteriales bacterium]